MKKKFWLRWVTSEEHHGTFELTSPWWVSGHRGNERYICAAVEAESESAAKAIIDGCHDRDVDISFRLILEQPSDWTPFCERFPRRDWMQWGEA